MLSFGMYYVVSNIYRQSVSRYIYYRQSKAYRRIKQARTFFLYGCVGFLFRRRACDGYKVSDGNNCNFLCDVCDVSVRDGRVMLKKDNLLSDVCWSLLGSRLNLRIVSTTRVCPKFEHTLLKDYLSSQSISYSFRSLSICSSISIERCEQFIQSVPPLTHHNVGSIPVEIFCIMVMLSIIAFALLKCNSLPVCL